MIMECTDCKYCADFDYGYRIFCLNSNLPSEEVLKYYPIGDRNAENCNEFEEDETRHFSMSQFENAEKYSEEKYGDVTYQGIREWCELDIKKGTMK